MRWLSQKQHSSSPLRMRTLIFEFAYSDPIENFPLRVIRPLGALSPLRGRAPSYRARRRSSSVRVLARLSWNSNGAAMTSILPGLRRQHHLRRRLMCSRMPPAIAAVGDLPEPEVDPPGALPEQLSDFLGTLQASLLSDPSDYSVGGDNTIEVHPLETLGHYADWLGLRDAAIERHKWSCLPHACRGWQAHQAGSWQGQCPAV